MANLIAIIWQVSVEIRIVEACKINVKKKKLIKLICQKKEVNMGLNSV